MVSLTSRQHVCGGQQTLKSVVYREFLRKAMIPILFIEVALIVFYFISVNYVTDKTVDVMSEMAKHSLINLSDVETRYINNKLKYIKYRTHMFHEEYETGVVTSLDSFVTDTLPTDLPWGSGAVILGSDGGVLGTSYDFQMLVDASVMGDHGADTSMLHAKHDFLKGNIPMGRVLQSLIAGNLPFQEFQLLGERYFVTQSLIKASDWQLIILTNMKSIYAPVYAQTAESQNLGFLVVLLVANFYLLFFVYLVGTARKFAARITQPIAKMSEFISHINQQKIKDEPIAYVKIKELDNLIDLNVEIQKAKQKYITTNAEIICKNKMLKRLAVTDQLTQAFNRLKLDEVLAYEIVRARRDKNPLSIVLLDIDHFKNVNDTYGHQAGDAVLVTMTRIIDESIRRTDILGRWGGEEFLLILPNTNLKNTAIQAEKLRRLVESKQFDRVGKVTISLGVSSCVGDCSERSLVERADKALYTAKEMGRNCVFTEEAAMPAKLGLVTPFEKQAIKYK